MASCPPAKREVSRRTADKWLAEYDRDLNTSVWLRYELANRDRVVALKCAVCAQFKTKLESMRNYRPAFIDGTTNVRTSTFKEHARTDMHNRAMCLFKKAQSSSVLDYAPIARALTNLPMDERSKQRTKRKFEISFVIAKEKLAFTKMKALCSLEERHGVDLGPGYRNDHACSTFIEYIASDLQQKLVGALDHSKFFSIQVDSSTDTGNSENELFLVLYFDPHCADGKVHVRDRYFTVRELGSGTATGLMDCLERAFQYMGITNWDRKLIGLGCDGCSANMGARGLRGLLQQRLPWVIVFWCLIHRLELSLKDALKNTFFSSVDEFLMQVYYVYEKSPKKCRELQDVVEELRACIEPTELPSGGDRPLRACGTRFVSHKVSALGRVIDRFGAYIAHLVALTEDQSVPSSSRQKLKGYITKWRDTKVIVGCGFFHDILQPVANLSKVLQQDQLCVVRAIDVLMKTRKNLDKLKATPFEQLPTVQKVLSRLAENAGSVTYQGQDLTRHKEGITYLKSHQAEYFEAINACIENRVKTGETEILSQATTILATHGWNRSPTPDFAHTALNAICCRFSTPLENAGVNTSLVEGEWDDMVEYGREYINLVQDDYTVVWWKLFNCVDANKWSNVLAIVELLFCVPVANGHLERVFSQLKLIKTNRRTSITENTLDDLVRINVEGPSLSDWDPTDAMQLWWRDKARRVNQRDSASTSSSSDLRTSPTPEREPRQDIFDWEEWEQLIGN